METVFDENIDMQKEELLSRLTSAIRSLEAVKNALIEEIPQLPKDKLKQFLEEKSCLLCNKLLDPSKKNPRGVHESCYKKIKRRINNGQTREDIEIRSGNLAPNNYDPKKFNIEVLKENSPEVAQVMQALYDDKFVDAKAKPTAKRKKSS